MIGVDFEMPDTHHQKAPSTRNFPFRMDQAMPWASARMRSRQILHSSV